MLSDRQQQEILEQLIIDNSELDRLESLLAEFNIFEAVGITRQEIKHSNFLAFLLDPLESHRLGDIFLKKLLVRILLSSENPPVKAIEIDIANWQDVEVRREWKNIDILIYSTANQIVCVIENKVDSSEHSDQLQRYKETVEIEFPKCRQIFLYLTKDGDSASSQAWLSVAYSDIAEVIESICCQYQSTIGSDVLTVIKHYVSLIRRHIVSNSEISDLCQKIYSKHRQALDLIYEHRPDLQSEISEYLQQLIKEDGQHNLVEDDHTKKLIRFAPKEWDNLAFQKTCENWTSSKRIVLFEFWSQPNLLTLNLFIGHGGQELKKAIFDAVKELQISGVVDKQLKSNNWSLIYRQEILENSDYSKDWDILQGEIKSFWDKQFDGEIKLIREAISKVQIST